MYKPSANQFTTPIRMQHRVVTDANGASEISYSDASPAVEICVWKSKGGTESIQSGSLVVEDTAEITMWFRPDISERDIVLQEETATAWQIQYDALISTYDAEVDDNGTETELASSLAAQISEWLISRPAYEIQNIENVEMRNVYMILKVKRVVNA